MMNEVAAFAGAQARSAVRRVATPLAFVLAAALFALFALAALFAALFFWVAPMLGASIAALIVAAVAIVLALLFLLPLTFRRRPPPPEPTAALPQYVSLLAQAAPKLGPKQLMIAIGLLAVALVLGSRASKK